MLLKALKVTALFTAGVAGSVLGVVGDNTTSKDDKQLKQLSDGMGNFIADGESFTQEEINAVKSRGEMYDTYL